MLKWNIFSFHLQVVNSCAHQHQQQDRKLTCISSFCNIQCQRFLKCNNNWFIPPGKYTMDMPDKWKEPRLSQGQCWETLHADSTNGNASNRLASTISLKRGRIGAQRRNKPLTHWPPAKSTSRNCISHVAPLLRQYPFNTLWNRTKSLGYTYDVIIPLIGVGNDLPSQCNCQHAAAMLGFLKPSPPVSCSKVANWK